TTVFPARSTSARLWALNPLEAASAWRPSASGIMFKGRSVSTTWSPAGERVQPLGRRNPFSVGPAYRGLAGAGAEARSSARAWRASGRARAADSAAACTRGRRCMEDLLGVGSARGPRGTGEVPHSGPYGATRDAP